MELVDLEYRRQGTSLGAAAVRIDKDGGVTLDDCAYISRELGDLLDVKEAIPRGLRIGSLVTRLE